MIFNFFSFIQVFPLAPSSQEFNYIATHPHHLEHRDCTPRCGGQVYRRGTMRVCTKSCSLPYDNSTQPRKFNAFGVGLKILLPTIDCDWAIFEIRRESLSIN